MRHTLPSGEAIVATGSDAGHPSGGSRDQIVRIRGVNCFTSIAGALPPLVAQHVRRRLEIAVGASPAADLRQPPRHAMRLPRRITEYVTELQWIAMEELARVARAPSILDRGVRSAIAVPEANRITYHLAPRIVRRARVVSRLALVTIGLGLTRDYCFVGLGDSRP